MRELIIGGKTVRVKASPLALLYYKQEFGSDLLGDFSKMKNVEKDPSGIDTVFILQLTWAMAKADAYGKTFSGFEAWLQSLDSVDFSDPAFFLAAIEEAAAGFLCRGK